MNKLVYGAVAGAAAIALLVGGAGSFAVWNSEVTVNAGTIQAGTLKLTATPQGAWTNVTPGIVDPTIDPATFRIVPGNVLEFRQVLSISATGDNLSATLTYDQPAVTNTLAGIVETTLKVTPKSGNIGVTNSILTVTNSKTGASAEAVLTLTFPEDAVAGQSGQLDLAAMTFALTQVPIA